MDSGKLALIARCVAAFAALIKGQHGSERAMMRFDSNQAWKDASEAVAANRDVLLALGGVFMLLPAFAVMVFFPMPELPSDPDRLSAVLGEYMQGAFPYLAITRLLELTGLLAMIALIADPGGPTVSQAIATGARHGLAALLAMLTITLMLVFASLLPALLAGALGKGAQLLLGLPLGLAIFAYGSARSMTVLPAIVAGRILNPFAAIQRGWAISRGNGWRLAAFLALLMIAFVILSWLFLNGLDILFRLGLGERGSKFGTALAASAVSALADVYFAALMTAVFRQLAPSSRSGDMDKAQ